MWPLCEGCESVLTRLPAIGEIPLPACLFHLPIVLTNSQLPLGLSLLCSNIYLLFLPELPKILLFYENKTLSTTIKIIMVVQVQNYKFEIYNYSSTKISDSNITRYTVL